MLLTSCGSRARCVTQFGDWHAEPPSFPRAGALPILAGNDVIGAIGFGGANGAQGGGTHDEACAKAGLDKIKARVK